MKRPVRTKTELLARIARGPASVEQVYVVAKYRVSVPDDPDPNGGVWISLGPEFHFVVEDYAAVTARVNGKEVRLTQREANGIARLVARAIRRRARPWKRTSATRVLRRLPQAIEGGCRRVVG